jgi:hypothetical protein
MNDKLDPLIDQTIEAEKQQALRHFHLSPLRPSLGLTGRVSGWPFPLRLTRAWIWGGCAAMVFLTFCMIQMLQYKGRSMGRVATSQAIEQAFLSVQKNQPGPVLPVFTSLSGDKDFADLSWNIQLAFCRLRRSEYPHQDLGEAVIQTLSRGLVPSRFGTSLDNDLAPGLDVKLRQLTSKNAVARVLSKQSQSQ